MSARKLTTKIDSLTRRWIRNAADERAAARGFRFDEARVENAEGTGVVDFIQQHLCLYEGEYAGQPVRLMDWQYELLARLFGWCRLEPEWKRTCRRFRKAGIWIPKKNGKSPTIAMIGLYLLVADGEQGQKIFSAAKDGQQAKISHTHAMKMVEMSPLLQAECSVNHSSGRIVHHPTNSVYAILSADNITGQEGLNGSVMIDECHVVDARLAKVIEYAGASRAEPLQVEASTAGNNPQGYGKRQFDYGQAVNEGTRDDDRFLYLYYGAAQDATDGQCATAEVQAAANPALGQILKASELMDACRRAEKSLADFAAFKMYRLNIWQASANPWLKQDDWRRCARRFTLDDLAGRDCHLGLDLSKTRDMTALVLMFRDEETGIFQQWPEFWYPEEAARANAHLAEYPQWHSDGFLHFCAGRTIDQRDVEARVKELAETVSIRSIVYDPMYAEELTKTLAEDLGVERVEFKQTILHFAAPTADYERLLVDEKLLHPDHPILNWQAGHVQVVCDRNANKRPVKPPSDDHRKIDGIVAGIMALRAATADGLGVSEYERAGVLYADDLLEGKPAEANPESRNPTQEEPYDPDAFETW
jgi:phage terminase large subunit-like protein